MARTSARAALPESGRRRPQGRRPVRPPAEPAGDVVLEARDAALPAGAGRHIAYRAPEARVGVGSNVLSIRKIINTRHLNKLALTSYGSDAWRKARRQKKRWQLSKG